MIVLDTNVVSELARRDGAAPQVIEWVNRCRAQDLYLTAVTVSEVLFGLAQMPAGRRREALARKVEAVISRTFASRVLPFDANAALHLAVISAACQRAGSKLPQADGLIAAICRSRDALLATRNVRDFQGTGVQLINPWDAD